MSDQRRILHVFKYFRPDFTGEGTFLERIAPAFRKARPDVGHDVLCTLTGEPQGGIGALDGIGSVRYLTARSNKSAMTFVELFWWTLRNIWRYDVVHYHTHVDRTFLSYWLASLLGKRIVLSATLDDSTLQIGSSYRAWLRPLVRRLLRRFDAFVSISPRLHAETVSDLGDSRAHLIPMGINMPQLSEERRLQARRNLGFKDDTRVLISVGALSERKDQMTLVRALPDIVAKFPDLVLVLMGPALEPVYAKKLDEFIQANGLQQNVRLAGWVQEPWPYYEAADMMVFASHEEGFGTAMIEAMSYALPVVARRLPGVNDVFIKSGETGFLFDQEQQFRDAVLRVLAEPDLRRKMGADARTFVIPRFGMDQISARYLAVYGLGQPG